MNIEQERAAFEAWMRDNHPGHCLIFVNGYLHKWPQRLWEAYQAGRAALQSQPTEAFPCRIIEADFETGTVTLEMLGKYTVSAGQKYLCNAPLQSQDGEKHLVAAIREAIELLGPEAPSCSGCEYEWNHALRVLREAIDHARRIEGEL